jgi:hypothetical protein
MDQDSKLITEAYRAMSNRGKGHHGEGLTAIEEIQIDLQEAEHRATDAYNRGDDVEGDRWQREAEDLESELRSLSLMRRNLNRNR